MSIRRSHRSAADPPLGQTRSDDDEQRYPSDRHYGGLLDRKSIPYESRVGAIRLAKQFCLDVTRQGNTSWLAGYNLQFKQGRTQTEAENFISGAVGVYCPQLWE